MVHPPVWTNSKHVSICQNPFKPKIFLVFSVTCQFTTSFSGLLHFYSSIPKPCHIGVHQRQNPAAAPTLQKQSKKQSTKQSMSGGRLADLLSEHPSIVNFRWSSSLSWGSTWSFLFTAIALYIAAAASLHIILSLFLPKHRRIPLGPIPALHSLSISVISATIFVGILLSAAAEIRETRWFWRRTKTVTNPLQWLLCFPLGTRPSGRVFFWSYIFYLSRFLHLFRTFSTILRKRKLTFFQILNQSFLLCMSFLWLEFSQSFQVLAIMFSTLLYAVVYGYRFWTAIGLPAARSVPFVVNCQVVLLVCNLVCHFGVLLLHFRRGGCNGIEAWVFNSVLNGVLLLLVMDFYVKKMHWRKRRSVDGGEDSVDRRSGGSSSSRTKET